MTTQRVLFLRRHWVFSLCFASLEEAFYLNDLQVRTLGLVLQLCCVVRTVLILYCRCCTTRPVQHTLCQWSTITLDPGAVLVLCCSLSA